MKFKYIMLISGLVLTGSRTDAAKIDASKLIQSATQAINGLTEVIHEDVEPAIKDIKNAVNTITTDAKGFKNIKSSKQVELSSEMITSIIEPLNELGKTIHDIGSKVVDPIGQAINSNAGNTVEDIGSAIEKVSEGLKAVNALLPEIADLLKAAGS